MGRNTAFKTPFGGKYPCTANDRHNMFTMLSANSLYGRIYGNGSLRNTKIWSHNTHQEDSNPAGKYSNVMVLHFRKKEINSLTDVKSWRAFVTHM